MREHKKEMAMLVHNQCQLPQKRFLVKKTEQIPTWVIITTMIPHKTKKKTRDRTKTKLPPHRRCRPTKTNPLLRYRNINGSYRIMTTCPVMILHLAATTPYCHNFGLLPHLLFQQNALIRKHTPTRDTQNKNYNRTYWELAG